MDLSRPLSAGTRLHPALSRIAVTEITAAMALPHGRSVRLPAIISRLSPRRANSPNSLPQALSQAAACVLPMPAKSKRPMLPKHRRPVTTALNLIPVPGQETVDLVTAATILPQALPPVPAIAVIPTRVTTEVPYVPATTAIPTRVTTAVPCVPAIAAIPTRATTAVPCVPATTATTTLTAAEAIARAITATTAIIDPATTQHLQAETTSIPATVAIMVIPTTMANPALLHRLHLPMDMALAETAGTAISTTYRTTLLTVRCCHRHQATFSVLPLRRLSDRRRWLPASAPFWA